MMTQRPETDDSVLSSSDNKVKCAVLFRKISPEYNPILENSLEIYKRRLKLLGKFFLWRTPDTNSQPQCWLISMVFMDIFYI